MYKSAKDVIQNPSGIRPGFVRSLFVLRSSFVRPSFGLRSGFVREARSNEGRTKVVGPATLL